MAAVTCADGGSRESPAVEMKEPESVRKKPKHDPAGKRMSDLNYLDDTDTKPSKKAEAFPANTWVFNPNSSWRVYWDMTILIFVVYVLFVAPFELAFVSGDLSYQQRTSTIFSKKQRKNLGLFLCNSVADSFFILDLFCTLNTALYNETFGEWILDHAQIVRSYSDSGWLWLDLLSIFPWDEIPVNESMTILRLLKLFRLIKLLRVLKAPRIAARWNKAITMSFKAKLVTKYAAYLVAILHFDACAIRMAHEIETSFRDDARTYLNTHGPSLYRGKFDSGIWAVYVDALDWGLQTMTGASLYITTAEGILSVIQNLMGLLFFSFLLADLTNVLCNLDPAANEFRQTVDCLNEFMAKEQFPLQTRYELRDYLMHSEVLFHTTFHSRLLNRLSPPLQASVAAFLLGRRIAQVPFFSYAKSSALGLCYGRSVLVRPHEKRGKICGFKPNIHFDVRYDDGDVEEDLPVGRLHLGEEDGEFDRRTCDRGVGTRRRRSKPVARVGWSSRSSSRRTPSSRTSRSPWSRACSWRATRSSRATGPSTTRFSSSRRARSCSSGATTPSCPSPLARLRRTASWATTSRRSSPGTSRSRAGTRRRA